MFPVEIYGEIMSWIPWSEQGRLRQTCRLLSTLVVTGHHTCKLPTTPEIISALFSSRNLTSETFTFITDRQVMEVTVLDKSQTPFYAQSPGILVHVRTCMDGRHLPAYLAKHFLNKRELSYFLMGREFHWTGTPLNWLRPYCQPCSLKVAVDKRHVLEDTR